MNCKCFDMRSCPNRFSGACRGDGEGCKPPCRQPRSKSEVNLPQMPPNYGGICIRADLGNHRFAPGLPPGWVGKHKCEHGAKWRSGMRLEGACKGGTSQSPPSPRELVHEGGTRKRASHKPARGGTRQAPPLPTLEVNQGQILSQFLADATLFWFHSCGS